MSVSVTCPKCDTSVPMSEEHFAALRGKSAKCRKCGHVFVVHGAPALITPSAIVRSASTPTLAEVSRVATQRQVAHLEVMVQPAAASTQPPPPPAPASLASMFQCCTCHGWFPFEQVYSLGNQYVCKRCHHSPAANPHSVPMPMYPQQPVVIQNVINNHTPMYHPVKRWDPATAAVLSFIMPGLGQMYKGQALNGLAWLFVTIAGYVFFIVPGVVLHICSIIGAAMGDPYR